MAIPDYQTCMLPLLKMAVDQKEHSLYETVETLASEFKLTEEEKAVLLPSGQNGLFYDRVGWAKTYLKKAGLLETTKRGFHRITGRGMNALNEKSNELNNKYLMQFPEFRAFLLAKGKSKSEVLVSGDGKLETERQTPDEALEQAYLTLRRGLAYEILLQVKACTPSFFEKLVVDLLVRMGYGGSRKDAGKAIGKTGDGGIDGIIKEDRLGLDIIYIQAKRWENTIGRPEIQKFAGALQGQRAKKGIFITTSDFTKDALEYARMIESKIILIDGDQLADYIIDFDIGVSKIATYDIKRIDSDYFIEE